MRGNDELIPTFGCWLCGKGKAADLSGNCDRCGSPVDVTLDLMQVQFEQYQPIARLGRGFYGYTLKAKNRIGKEFALKVVPSSLYATQGKDFDEEVQRYLHIGEHPNLVPLLDAGETKILLRGTETKVFYLVLPYLKDARELEKAIDNDPITVDFLISVTRQLSSAIAFLETRTPPMLHNDLHGRNILLQTLQSTEFDHAADVKEVIKVVDFGSAIFRGAGPVKPRDDIQWLGEHMRRIRNRLLQLPALDPGQRSFIFAVDRLITQAVDPDPGRRPTAAELWEGIEELLRKTLQQRSWQRPKLSSLSSYPNALQFPDESYIFHLYSREFPWLRERIAPDQPLLITGPRGCGKTMILRHADLRTAGCKLREDESVEVRMKRLSDRDYLGVFLSCRTAFSVYLATGATPAWLDDASLVIAFFNLNYFIEAVNGLIELENEGLAVLQPLEKTTLDLFLQEQFSELLEKVEPPETHRQAGLGIVLHWHTTLVRVCDLLISGRLPTSQIPRNLLTPNPLRNLAVFLSTQISAFRAKRIIYLLDDFSHGVLPTKAQKALLPLVFSKVPEYVFWVSSHSMSVPKQDLSGLSYDHNRDYCEINAGWEYVAQTNQLTVCEKFLEDIFKRRFSLWGKLTDKTLVDILGYSDYPGGIGRYIRELYEQKKLYTLRYYGTDVVARLCTGDISFILDLVAGIIASNQEDKLPVSKEIQNKRIRGYAREQRLKLRDYCRRS